MAETINWSYNVRAVGGPSLALSGDFVSDGYEKLSVTVAATTSQSITIGPGTWTSVTSLVISATSFVNLTVAPDGGTPVALDGPIVLIGAGPVALLGIGDATLLFDNTDTVDVTVDIFVARDATP